MNSADHDMVTALHLAATKGNDCNERINVVKTLVRNNEKLNLSLDETKMNVDES